MHGKDSTQHQLFKLSKSANKHGKTQLCDQDKQCITANGASVRMANRVMDDNTKNSYWYIRYLDEMPPIPTSGKGSMGFEINRAFHIVTGGWLKKELFYDNGNVVLRTNDPKNIKADDDAYKWIYDEKTKTIRTDATENRVLDISGSTLKAVARTGSWSQ